MYEKNRVPARASRVPARASRVPARASRVPARTRATSAPLSQLSGRHQTQGESYT
jgi:hypothetical protein